MTEDYKPTDNAVAERINGIIKVERLYRQGLFETIERAAKRDRALHLLLQLPPTAHECRL
ncbi:hypothetical protein NXX37_06810 [Parabacteroides distasonis]|nr:hypothetical protein NXX37_06810 [Parabacteroides distasonis]